MYCTRCGSKTEEVARFCSQCGTLVAASADSSAPTFAPPPSSFDTPQLTRSLKNRRIAGVCAGIARYFAVDPTLVRILFVAGIFFPILPAFIPYLICWIAMPLENPPLPAQMPVYGGSQAGAVSPLPR